MTRARYTEITPELREKMREQTGWEIKRAMDQFGYDIPKVTLDFNSLEGITRINTLYAAGFSHSVIAALVGSRRKTVQHFLAYLRKAASNDKLSNADGTPAKQHFQHAPRDTRYDVGTHRRE